MRKFLGVGMGIGITIVLLLLLFSVAYNYLFPEPHVHYSSDPNFTIKTLPNCTSEGLQYRKCDGCGEMYGEETLAALGHKLSAPKKVNVKTPDCETAGSYDMEVRCSECNYLEREHFTVPALGHKSDGNIVTGNFVEPDCENPGSYDEFTHCSVCKKQLPSVTKDVPAKGHNFVFELVIEDGEKVLRGACITENCGHKFDPSVDTDYTYKIVKNDNLSTPATCVKGEDVFEAIIYNNGKEVCRAQLRVDTDAVCPHELMGKPIEEYAQYDEDGEIYYNISTPGIYLVYDKELGQNSTNVWDADGFAVGVYKCDECGNWFAVRVYNDLAETND